MDGFEAVPAHWEVTTIKRFSTLQRGHDLTDLERTDGPYPVVTSGGVAGTHGAFVAKGPGVVTGRYGSTGRLFYIEEDFWPHNTALYVKDFHGNLPRFVWYSLQCVDFAAHSAKAAVPGIDRNDIHGLPAVVPPHMEQAAIAAFLDRELAKIDALVAEQQRLIDLLKEKRQAIISDAVTKGLNPNAKMRPTGIEWLGDVPAHWTAKKLRVLFRATKRQDQTDMPVLSVYRDYGVIRKDSRDDNINKTPEDLSAYQLVMPGDLVVNKMKAWQGSLGVSDLEGITSPDYVVFAPCHAESAAFLHLLLRSQCMVSTYRGISNGIRTDQWRLEPAQFLGLTIHSPPADEQQRITSFASEWASRFDVLTAEAERAVVLLQERRTGLISAAVTGQIDVRGLAASEVA